MAEETGGTGLGHRQVTMSRVAKGEFEVTNARGGTMRIGSGENADFTPVELLLASIAGCSAVDVDFITTKRVEPSAFDVRSSGEKVRDEHGNRIEGLRVEFRVEFPEGPEGDAARERLPQAIQKSHDRLCTVTRTVELGTPVTAVQAAPDGP